MSRICFWKTLLFTLLTGCVLAEEVVVTVYSSPEAVVSDISGKELGRTGQAFRVEVGDGKVTLVLSAEGYKSADISLTADELRSTKRIPAQGVLNLESESSPVPLVIVGLLVLGVGGAVWKRRKGAAVTQVQYGSDVFEKGEQIGEGGTAFVYAATSELAPDKELAVKILKPECANDGAVKGRLLRSLESSKSLDHPNLVKVYACGSTSGGLPFILLERLRGVTLEQYLRKTPRPELSDALNVLEALCSVLKYLHEKTVVHRDVKPENIFLTKDDRVKLMDLEISRSKDSEDLTKTGVVVGTPYYLAPEQIRGEVMAQSDQYSLGIIFFEMLTGEKPFQGKTSMDLINQHLSKPVPSIRALNPSVTALQE
ncbi:MAG: serine/threonine protein kinase, partial [Candidatus Eremiobacteraeota bacterium]|nr:serine/threonine protein kinase [Candidatus Eremiobacteraeota bacterium]